MAFLFSLACEEGSRKPARPPEFPLVSLQKHAKGQDLLKKVCDHLNLLEEDYFGLAIWDTPTSRVSAARSVPGAASASEGSSPPGAILRKLF